MNLSIVIPVFNEIKLLPKILLKIIKDTKRINKEIIIVDDCSTDGTKEWLLNIKKKFNHLGLKKNKLFFSKKIKSNLKIFLKKKNEGKGSAVNIGLKETTKKIIAIQDADLEYAPKDLNKMISHIKKGKADVVYGNRFSTKKNRYHYFAYAIGNYVLSTFVSILFSTKLSDVAVCYKMFKRDVIKNIKFNSNDFMFDFEFTSKVLKKKKWKFTEVDILYKGRTFAEGKKISWVDGFRALLVIVKIKLFF